MTTLAHSDLLFQTSDTTWQAYNTYGGNSLYFGSPAGRAYKVSYNRPFTTRCCDFPNGSNLTWLFNTEYPMVRWLERNGYDVSYTTGIDTDRRGSELLEHRVFMPVGHDEYRSGAERANVEAARAAGVHIAIFSGNHGFWKTRWESSIDGSGTPYRTLVCYKETHANAKIDPLPNVWTGTWRDPRFSPPADGGRPENALNGSIFTVNGYPQRRHAGAGRRWQDALLAQHPHRIARRGPGRHAADGRPRSEWDEDLDNGFRPAGVVRMSSTTVSGVQYLQDYGTNYASGTATHHLTLYKHPSGALVFGAGTIQWSWGLDDQHDFAGPRSMRTCSRRRSTCSPTWACSPPHCSPGSSPPRRRPIPPRRRRPSPRRRAARRLQRQADDHQRNGERRGGRVGGVEVSTDGGTPGIPPRTNIVDLRLARPNAVGATSLRARAVDDSGNLGTASQASPSRVAPT